VRGEEPDDRSDDGLRVWGGWDAGVDGNDLDVGKLRPDLIPIFRTEPSTIFVFRMERDPFRSMQQSCGHAVLRLSPPPK
jgi:hypothetical protein